MLYWFGIMKKVMWNNDYLLYKIVAGGGFFDFLKSVHITLNPKNKQSKRIKVGILYFSERWNVGDIRNFNIRIPCKNKTELHKFLRKEVLIDSEWFRRQAGRSRAEKTTFLSTQYGGLIRKAKLVNNYGGDVAIDLTIQINTLRIDVYEFQNL